MESIGRFTWLGAIPGKMPRWQTDEFDQRALALYQDTKKRKGMNAKQFAEALGVESDEVINWLSWRNLPGIDKNTRSAERKMRAFFNQTPPANLTLTARMADKYGMSYGEFVALRDSGQIWWGPAADPSRR